MPLDFNQLGEDIRNSVLGAAQEFYGEGREMAQEDKVFFMEIATDYREVSQLYLKAKVEGDDNVADEMQGNLRQLTATVRAKVSQRALDIDEAAKGALGDVLKGIGSILGKMLTGVLGGML